MIFMNLSNMIAGIIADMVSEQNGYAEIRRNELAEKLGCVPSQINYVISSRFTPEHGYIVESRRGGGGYIRITRVRCDSGTAMMHVINSIGDAIEPATVRAHLVNLHENGLIDTGTANLMLAALSDASLRDVPQERRDTVRARIFKNMMIHLK